MLRFPQDDVLVQAAFDGNIVDVQRLVEGGADPNVMGRNWNPLHAAIENMRVDVVHYLLTMGADREFMCAGLKPIHHAIDIEIDAATQANLVTPPDPILTALLIDAGADLNARTEQGQTPLKMATELGHVYAVELLRSRSAHA